MTDTIDTTGHNPTTSNVSEKWLDLIRQAAPGGPDKVKAALNRSAYIVGMQIPRGRLDEKQAGAELIRVAVEAGLPAILAQDTVWRGMRAGKQREEQAIEERQALYKPATVPIDTQGAPPHLETPKTASQSEVVQEIESETGATPSCKPVMEGEKLRAFL
jgi:hypothetical protein